MPNTTTATWPTLTAGKVAKASDVEAKFDFSEAHLWPHLNGSLTSNTYDLGNSTSAYWRTAWLYSLNATTTAQGIAIGTTTVYRNSDVAFEVAGTRAVLLPRLSTAQIANLTAVDGMVAFNTSTSQLQVRRNGAWVNVGGPVYQAFPMTTTTGGGASTTVTLINVASGGGRLHGVAFRSGAAGPTYNFSIILDGVTMTGYAATASTLYSVIPNGVVSQMQYTQMTGTSFGSTFVNTTTGSPVMPYLGWDFASTCVIHVAGGLGGGMEAWAVISKIV